MSMRMLVLWCPDWPAVAAATATDVPARRPGAVFSANRVVACSAAARAAGVRRGMRRRDAQSRCPELAVFGVDEGRDTRLFEPVAAAVEELVVGVEVVRPGLVAVPVRGAAGYFGGQTVRESVPRRSAAGSATRTATGTATGAATGTADPRAGSEAEPARRDRGPVRERERAGELRLVELLLDHVSTHAGVECQIGVADGLFAATLAAHRSALVERGATAEFLAPLSIAELDQPGAGRAELVDLLRRLGLSTLGAFAALGERDVVSRFGSAGLLAHRLARGRSERPPHRRRPPPELTVTEEFDPPLDRVDAAAFMARTLAARFHAGLAGHGLACTRLGIHAGTEHGGEFSRVWRCAEPLTPQGIADRVRWQFEGWLRAAPDVRPASGVSWLRLEPEETVEGKSLQLGLWQRGLGDEQVLAAEQAGRALVRVQGLLGPEGVFTAVLDGGRGPAERVRLVPWGGPRTTESPPEQPWPGRLPAPSPATVFERTVPARIVDRSGARVGITDRGELTAAPHAMALDNDPPRRVLDWAGPWLVDTEWWLPAGPRVRTRIQALLDSGVAVLLTAEGEDCEDYAKVRVDAPVSGERDDRAFCTRHCPQWRVEGVYD